MVPISPFRHNRCLTVEIKAIVRTHDKNRRQLCYDDQTGHRVPCNQTQPPTVNSTRQAPKEVQYTENTAPPPVKQPPREVQYAEGNEPPPRAVRYSDTIPAPPVRKQTEGKPAPQNESPAPQPAVVKPSPFRQRHEERKANRASSERLPVVKLHHKDPKDPVAKEIAADRESHAIVQKLNAMSAETKALDDEKEAIDTELSKLRFSWFGSRRKHADNLIQRSDELKRRRKKLIERQRKEMLSLFNVKRPMKIGVTPTKDSLDMPDHTEKNLMKALMFVRGMCDGGIDGSFSLKCGNNVRAEIDPKGREIHIDTTDRPSIIAHEIGHLIEFHKPGASEAARRFLAYRTKGEDPVNMGSIPGHSGMDGEYGMKDDFDKAFPEIDAYYVGKIYEESGGTVETEILSMGIQALYDDPVGFATKDPEYAQFVIGLLRRP